MDNLATFEPDMVGSKMPENYFGALLKYITFPIIWRPDITCDRGHFVLDNAEEHRECRNQLFGRR